MPWTASDAAKHKKGLNSSQAKKWARIANSARKECLSNGGSEKVCDGRAIKIANSQVGRKNDK